VRRLVKLFSLLFAWWLCLSSANGQTYTSDGPQPGSLTRHGITIQNLDVKLSIPIISKKGTGIDLKQTFNIDNNLWYNNKNQLGQGKWTAKHFGFNVQSQDNYPFGYFTEVSVGCGYEFTNYIDMRGFVHEFPNGPICLSSSNGTPVLLTDGSGYTIRVNPSNTPSTVTLPNGTVVYPFTVGAYPLNAKIVDVNGNNISQSVEPGTFTYTFTDTLGTTNALALSGNSSTNCYSGINSYTYPTSAGSASINVNCSQHTIQTNFGCANISEFTPAAEYLPDSIDLPDGSQYALTYESQVVGTVTGRLSSITYPNGSITTFQYTGTNNGISCTDGGPSGLIVTDADGVWTYIRSGNVTTVTSPPPANNKTIYTFVQEVGPPQATFPTQVQIYQGGSQLLQTITTCYNGNLTNCATATAPTFPITETDTFTTFGSSAQASHIKRLFDSFGNTTLSAFYDFGASTPTRQIVESGFGASWNGSTTAPACSTTIGSGVNDVPCQIQVWDGSNNVLRSTYFAYGTTTNPGSVLKKAVWTGGSSFLVTSATYNSNGTLATTTDANGNVTTNSYQSCNALNNSLLSKVTPAVSSLAIQFSWDPGCNLAKMISATGPNGYPISTSYGDPLWRPTAIKDQLNNTVTMNYGHSPISVESQMSFGSSDFDSLDTADALGRPYLSQHIESANGNWDTVQRGYSWDGTGRVTTVTTPCVAARGSGCSNGTTTTTHDALGRTLIKTDGGGKTLTYGYSMSTSCTPPLVACAITNASLGPVPTGEVLKKVVLEYNGLGQLVALCSISSSTGSTSCGFGGYNGFPTTYTYNPDGTIAAVTKTSSTNSQTHSFTYDAHGRTLTASYPESGTKYFFYDFAPSSPGISCSTLSLPTNAAPLGNLLKTYDANGTTTCYSYDSIGRKIGTAYSGPNFDGANKYFVYDAATVNGVSMTNAVGRLAEAYTVGNAVYNPNFRSSNNWGLPAGWSISNGQEYAVGATDVASSNLDSTGSPWKPIRPGQTVNMSGWIYRSGGTGVMDWGGAFVDANHTLTGWFNCGAATSGSTGTGSWTYVTSSSIAPANTAYYELYTELHGCNDTDQTQTSGYFTNLWATVAGQKTTDEGFSYTARGELSDVYESTPNSGGYYHTTATYFPNHALKTLGGIPGGPWTYTLDGKGRPYSVVDGSSLSLVNSTTYNAADQPCVINLGLGDIDTYVYDNDGNCASQLTTGRMTSYTFAVGAPATTETGSLNWNSNGTLRSLSITDNFNPGGTQACAYGSSTTPGYDELGRLVSVVCTNSSGANVWGQAFSYDAFNNLTKTVPSGNTGITWQPGYNQSNNHYLLGGTSYDANGNLLKDTFHTYTWNQDNHLLTVTGGTNAPLVYDALGRMVERLYGTTYKEPLFSPVGNIGLMSNASVSQYRIPLPGGLTYTSGSSYWHKDWLGSVRMISYRGTRKQVADIAFAPYGETYNTFGSTAVINFTGDNQDMVGGTYDTPTRELNPNQGRWISPDAAHGGWNAYSYSTNPLSERDPNGTDPLSDLFSAYIPEGESGVFDMPTGDDEPDIKTGISCCSDGLVPLISSEVADNQIDVAAPSSSGVDSGLSSAGSFNSLQTLVPDGTTQTGQVQNLPPSGTDITGISGAISGIVPLAGMAASLTVALPETTFGALATEEIAVIGRLADTGVWAARGYNVFQATGTLGEVAEANVAWVEEVIANGNPVIVASDLTEGNVLGSSGGLFEEGFTAFGDELGMLLEAGFEFATVEEAGEVLLVLALL
jgi:RHS repeat-associated protein